MSDKSLEQEVKSLCKLLKIPGALVLFKSDKYDSFLLKYGYSDLKNKDNVNKCDHFRVGSITKMFTGIVLLQLYEEGIVNLDNKVSDYFIGLPDDFKNVTIRELGNMRSGIPDYYDNSKFQKEFNKNPYRNWSPSELLSIGIINSPLFKPGTEFDYSNTNTVLLALIIERLTKNTIQHEIQKRILDPLNMKNTKMVTNSSLQHPHMNGYQYNNDKLTNVTHYNMSWTWGDGFITSNLNDMKTFIVHAIGKHELLDKNATRQQRKFIPISDGFFGVKREYGFTLLKTEEFIGHNGSLSGYNTFNMYESSTNTSLIVVCNITETKHGILPAYFINDYIIARLNNMTTYEEAVKLIEEINNRNT